MMRTIIFKYGVTDADPKRIELIAEGLLSGDAISPYTTPNTHFVCEENDEIVWLPSGITINNIVTNGDTVSFDVIYEDIISKDIKYETRIMAADNRIYMELSFSSDMYVVNEDITIYAKDGDSSSPISFYRKKYPNANNRNVFILDTEEVKCKKDTEYTIIIPAKTLMSSYGKYNEDIVLKVRTSDYTELQTVTDREDVQGNVNCVSGDRILLEGDRYVYFAMKDDNLYMIESSMNGIVSERFIAQIEDYNLSKNFRNIKARRLENGEYVVLQYSECTHNVFRIRADYTVERIEGLSECYELYTVGDQAVFVPEGFHEQTNFALVTDNNEVIVKEIDTPSGYVRDIYHMEDGLYLIAPTSGNYVSIVDEELNIVKCGRVQGIENVLYATGYDDVYVFIGYDKGVKAYFVNKDLELLYTKEILYTDNVYQFDGIYKIENGYAIAIMFDRTYYNDVYGSSLSGWVSSPVCGVIFLDKKFEKVTSCTVDYGGGNLGDRIETVFDFGNGRYGFSTMWATYMTDKIDLASVVLAILEQPQSQEIIEGANAVFTVEASGSKLSYQWQFRTSAEGEWKNSGMTGSKTNSITVQGTTARNGYQYRCVITEVSGNKVISNAATLTLAPKLAITSQPVSQSVAEGKKVVFKVEASGSKLSYQWQVKTVGSTKWTNSGMTGSKTDSITVQGTAARNGYQYRCVITDGNGNKVSSNGATLTVAPKLAITGQPASQSVAERASAVFKVTATGSKLSYQWQVRTSAEGEWKNSGMTGSKTDSITVQGTAARNGYQYRCVITDGSGNKVTSNGATLTVAAAIAITGQPESQNVTKGANAVFKVTATGNKLSYQWQFRTSASGTWKNSGMAGATTDSITVQGTTARNGYQYRCVITDVSGNKVTSNGATLTVAPALTITSQPASQSVTKGASAVFKVEASGSNLSYQWQVKTSEAGAWKNSGMTGSKTNSITVQGTAARNGYQYRCVITDGSGNKVTSNGAILTVK